MTFIHYPDSQNLTPKDIGGKAYSLYCLGREKHLNLNIPAWFTVKENTQNLVSGDLNLKAQYQRELQEALSKFQPDQLWAVRSSASSEDGVKNSFAGQLDTFLCVRTSEVEAHIEKVWASILSDHFLHYTQDKNIEMNASPAVMVQTMVSAKCAGVGFGVNPVTQEKEYMVSAVFGLGNLLVSGQSDADTWVVKNQKIIESSIAHKPIKEVLDPSLYGTLVIDNEKANQNAASLSDSQVLEVQSLIARVSEFYHHPQDIEWAFDEHETLHLLQSRPITTINEGAEILWDNSNIAESYGGVTTPLTFSFAKKAYENVYRELCLLLSIPAQRVTNHDIEFRNMLGLVRGRVYYNMNSWYKTLALLPGFSLNRTFMEQMMGVKEELSAELLAEIGRNTTQNKFRDAWGIVKTSVGLVSSLFCLDSTVKNFYARLDSALKPTDLKAMSLSHTMAYYNSLELKLLKKWDAPMVNDLFAMVFYGLMRKLSKSWCGDANESMQNTLILTQGNIISAEPARLMKKMALRIHALGFSSQAFESWRVSVQNSNVQRDIDLYLERFGDRCLDELKLESITLTDDPSLLYHTLYEMCKNDALMKDHQDGRTNPDDASTAQMLETELLGKLSFVKKHVFAWIIKMARKTVRERENLRFERTRLFGRVRRIFLSMGEKMSSTGTLEDSRDIFYLEVGEIQSFIEGTSTLTDLKGLVSLRKKEFEAFHQTPEPSDRFVTYGAVYQNNRYTSRTSSVKLECNMQRGLGCCPGIVRGRVKIIKDPKNAKVEKGDILVAERTDPGWIMLFSSVSAILVEKGSLLSHAAIVSRELNLPAVVSVPGLLAWLKDGDTVEMDGTTGVITKIEPIEAIKAIKAIEPV